MYSVPSPLSRLLNIPYLLLISGPLAVLQSVLSHIATHVARSRPKLFTRLGQHQSKRFLINPIDLPFIFVLVPDSVKPQLTLFKRCHGRG